MATLNVQSPGTQPNWSSNASFPSPFTFILNNPVPLPRWWEKVHDVEIAARWKHEIIKHDRAMVERLWGGEKRFYAGKGEKQWPRETITDAQLQYLFDELRYLASQRDEETGTLETTIPMVYEASALIPASLKASLRSLATRLEEAPEDEKDWHPGSNKQVLDLVHPSLFCLRLGRSFVRLPPLERADTLRLLTVDDYFSRRPDIQHRYASNFWERNDGDPLHPFEYAVSQAHQWLPTDFAVSESARVVPQGYINNLHPTEHADSYDTISAILERFLPLFERVLGDQLSPPRVPVFPIDPAMWYDHLDDKWPEAEMPGPERKKWERLHHWPQIPDAAPFHPPSPEGRISLSLKGRTLQVIVKMANIVLTPAAPSYPGGAWHVEGMANEKIVATGLYYYDSANITESRLAFRAAVGDGQCLGATYLNYEQWDHRGFLTVYGITHTLALNQQLGHVVAAEDKCVVFPNIYQHRVAPFGLADPSRGGHRKILAFFLVDPLISVHSTSDVPPQQAEWYRDAVYGLDCFKKLPAELVEVILEYVSESTVSLEEAKADREELMKERARFVKTHNEELFEAEFSMCEH